MLQFITQPESRFSVAEQCQMVIEGGCRWIILDMPGAEDSAVREVASELIPLCKENETMLSLSDQPNLAMELGVHGVLLSYDGGHDEEEFRNVFGPEAIIGVDVKSAQKVLSLKGLDVDYVSLSFRDTSDDEKKEIVRAAMLKEGNVLPVVFDGDFTIENVQEAILQGASGVSTGKSIMESNDPVDYTRRLLIALKKD